VNTLTTLTIDLSPLIEQCQVQLLAATPIEIAYADRDNLANNELPELIDRDPINIYAIWILQSGKAWKPMYIGQRQLSSGWSRVRQHLFSTPSGTQSKLEKVREVLSRGYSIGVTKIAVRPDSMRLAIEEELIFRNTPLNTDLPWNEKARQKPLLRTELFVRAGPCQRLSPRRSSPSTRTR
jgi:hypothetical protein